MSITYHENANDTTDGKLNAAFHDESQIEHLVAHLTVQVPSDKVVFTRSEQSLATRSESENHDREEGNEKDWPKQLDEDARLVTSLIKL